MKTRVSYATAENVRADVKTKNKSGAAALFCCRPLITHQQGQTGLSTVGAAHSLAVDWLGWVCYLYSLSIVDGVTD